ncbi:AraC family transcriptional regulator [Xanthobacter sp. V2C-8]|uniref:helix-turn-helix domain-containing protein n=1 Tax=Xanthobacter albus TaxID=3119929 RepID=UPI0037298980
MARRKRAVHLLTKTHMSIADIAASLGYEEHANFTRAFGRWQQCSPSEFRRMNGQDLP